MKYKSDIQKQRNSNLRYFKSDILPLIKERYDVIIYDKFVKIFHNSSSYDYYPMCERIYKPSIKRWKDLTIEEFVKIFLKK